MIEYPPEELNSVYVPSNFKYLDAYVKYKDLMDLSGTGGSTTDLTGYATEIFVNNAISSLVASAPTTLDTLNELATAINNDSSFSTTMVNLIGTKAPLSNPSFTGNVSVSGLTTTNTLTVSSSLTVPSNSIPSTAINNSTFVDLTTDQTLNGNKTINNLKTNSISELIVAYGNTTSNAISVSYTSGTLFYCTPVSSTNISLAITNIPTTNSYCTYNMCFILNTSSYRSYINSLTVNGSAVTMIASGGLSNILVNTSSVVIIQQIVLVYTSSTSSPWKGITNISYLY